VSKILKLDVPLSNRVSYPIEFEKTEAVDAELTDMIVPYNSEAVGKRIGELGVPDKCLIVLISREGKFVIPSGGTVVESGDVLLVLASREDFASLQRTVSQLNKS
jgi:cell volume regulation protein A